MSKFLHADDNEDDDNSKAIAVPQVFPKDSQDDK